jgi:hypothetical protein
VAVIDLTSRKFSLLIGGVDFAQSLLGEFSPQPTYDLLDGLAQQSGEIELVQTPTTPESLDPEVNTRWVIGQRIEVWLADSAGTLQPLPQGGYRILTVPAYSDEFTLAPKLKIEYRCELGFWDELNQPAADCTDVDPRIGQRRDTTVIRVLTIAGVPEAQCAPIVGTMPDLLYYPLQKSQGESFVRQAGLLSATCPAGARVLSSDYEGSIHCTPSATPATPTVTLDWSEVIDPERVDPREFARPFERLKVTGPQITVTPYSYPRELQPEERYGTLAALFPQYRALFGENPPLVLIEGSYGTEDWNGVDTLTIRREVRGIAGIEVFAVFGVGGQGYNLKPLAGQTLERWTYHPKPAGWDSCRPERNPRSLAGLVSRVEVRHLSTGYAKDTEYEYDDRQNLIRQATTIIYASGQPIQASQSFPPRPPIDAARGYSTQEIRWEEQGRGSGVWNQRIKARGPGGVFGGTYTAVNGQANEPVMDAPEQVILDSPPPRPPVAPTGFVVNEEPIEVEIIARARGGGIAEKTKTMTVPLVTSEAQLESLGKLLAAIAWGRAFGRRFICEVPDSLLNPATYAPVQLWRVRLSPDSPWLDLRVEAPLLTVEERECGLTAQGWLVGSAAEPGDPITLPYQPVVRGRARQRNRVSGGFKLSLPPVVVAGVAAQRSRVRASSLAWDALTETTWDDLTVEQWEDLRG